jgi:hypothetical protein
VTKKGFSAVRDKLPDLQVGNSGYAKNSRPFCAFCAFSQLFLFPLRLCGFA